MKLSVKSIVFKALFVIIPVLVIWGGFCLTNKYLYRRDYSRLIQESMTIEINDEFLILSIIKAESGFDTDSESKKGAVGLMQIMPDTAKFIADGINIEKYDLHEPSDNILLGINYLNYLYKKFGDMRTAICAYNGGEGNVSEWLTNKDYSDDGKTLKSIPFIETRKYLLKVERYYKKYCDLYNGGTRKYFCK